MTVLAPGPKFLVAASLPVHRKNNVKFIEKPASKPLLTGRPPETAPARLKLSVTYEQTPLDLPPRLLVYRSAKQDQTVQL